jgi:hypothetical protein
LIGAEQSAKEFGEMNGNYEWNKQFTRQKTQQRYREAELYRQARQQPRATREQAKGYVHVLFGKIILFVPKRLAAFSSLVRVQTQTEKVR